MTIATIQLQPRDFEILKFVFAHRVVTFDQIVRKFFPERHRTAASRRLRRLSNAGMLKVGARLAENKVQRYFYPAEGSIEAVASLCAFNVDNPHFKSESVEHDIRVTELRLRLEKLKQFTDFLPENLLQSSSHLKDSPVFGDFVRVQSDGALVLLASDKKEYVFSVEMEIHSKGFERYKSKLSSYYLTDSVEGVIYVCADQGIIKCLVEADKAVRGNRDSILYFGLEKNTIAAPDNINFENAKEHGVEFN